LLEDLHDGEINLVVVEQVAELGVREELVYAMLEFFANCLEGWVFVLRLEMRLGKRLTYSR